MSTYKTGILGYNTKTKRFGLLIMDLWEIDGFHCGDCFEIWNSEEEKWIPDRIEKAFTFQSWDFTEGRRDHETWYLVESRLKGSDLEGLKIRIAS